MDGLLLTAGSQLRVQQLEPLDLVREVARPVGELTAGLFFAQKPILHRARESQTRSTGGLGGVLGPLLTREQCNGEWRIGPGGSQPLVPPGRNLALGSRLV